MEDFKAIIEDSVKQALKSLGAPGVSPIFSVEHPSNPDFGDYSTNAALMSFKAPTVKTFPSGGKAETHAFPAKARSARELAEKLTGILRKEKALTSIVSKIEVAGPGFINFTLSKSALLSQLKDITDARDKLGQNTALKGKKIMVEYAHPNTHKEMHIGHMRTLITGEALARIFELSGAKVFRANYQGDIGPHVAKSIWGTEKILKGRRLAWVKAEKMPLKEKAHLLGEGYVRGNRDYAKHQKEIDDLNQKLYKKDPKIWPVYERTRRWSLEYYDAFYKRFDTEFDKLYFESEVAEPGKKIVEKNLGKVFERSEGAIIFDGEKHGLHKRVFVTAAGTPTYEAKDMALAPMQYKDFPFDANIHVVANEQSGYFKVIIKALELITPESVGRQVHLPMGMVNLVGRKMSSRTGDIITVDDLLDGVKALLQPLINKEGLSEKEIDKIAEDSTVAAVKCSVLKTDPTLNVAFDPKKSVSLEGDSGPYLQYTHARARSVLCKSKVQSPKFRVRSYELNEEELAILRWIPRFPEVVEEAAKKYAPNLICSFLFELAQRYNTFYNKHRIVDAKDVDSRGCRLLLTSAVAQVVENGLTLLAIAAPERM